MIRASKMAYEDFRDDTPSWEFGQREGLERYRVLSAKLWGAGNLSVPDFARRAVFNAIQVHNPRDMIDVEHASKALVKALDDEVSAFDLGGSLSE